ncbi:MAG: hypothetical protein ACK55Z_27575 [bacterium]
MASSRAWSLTRRVRPHGVVFPRQAGCALQLGQNAGASSTVS